MISTACSRNSGCRFQKELGMLYAEKLFNRGNDFQKAVRAGGGGD
jgi:hypothetical protein